MPECFRKQNINRTTAHIRTKHPEMKSLGDAEGFIKKNFATLTGVEILGVNYFKLACELAVSNELSGRLQSGR